MNFKFSIIPVLLFLLISFNSSFALTSVIEISHLRQILKNEPPFKKGDIVFVDIDGVLLSEGGDHRDTQLLSTEAIEVLESLKKIGVITCGLTARKFDSKADTYNNLKKYNISFNNPSGVDFKNPQAQYYKGIIFSPNIHEDVKRSTKLTTVKHFLDHLKTIGQNIGHVSVVDNEKFHFTQTELSTFNFANEPILYHFIREFPPFYVSEAGLSVDLASLSFISAIEGGSGAVIILADTKGKKWTLKSWHNKLHGINECAGADIYKALFGNAPAYMLYDDLPESLIAKIAYNGVKLHKGGLYRIAEFVEGRKPTSAQLKQLTKQEFYATALISFWDVKPDNYIIDARGVLHLVDTGGSFLYHALGRPKKWDEGGWVMHQLSELSTFRQKENLAHAAFEDHFQEFDVEAVNKILKSREHILDKVKCLCDATHYIAKSSLLYMIESRLNHLDFLSDYHRKCLNTRADPFAMGTPLDAAGALLYLEKDGVIYTLLGQRRGHKWWGNLGGKVDRGEALYEAAMREVREESGGKIDIASEVLTAPSHDLLTLENDTLIHRFRTYLVKVSPKLLTETFNNDEYEDYCWVPLKTIQDALYHNKPILEEGKPTLQLSCGKILHPPFVESFKQDHIQAWVQALLIKEKVPATCTQSLSGGQKLSTIDQISRGGTLEI